MDPEVSRGALSMASDTALQTVRLPNPTSALAPSSSAAGPSTSPSGSKQSASAARRRRRLNVPSGAGSAVPGGTAPVGDGGVAATPVSLPPELPLPITVARICVPEASGSVHRQNLRQTGPDVERGTPLFDYYAGIRPSPSQKAKGKARAMESGTVEEGEGAEVEDPPVRSFDSPVEGTVEQWGVAEGQVLREEDGWRSRAVVRIKEPCTHAVQWQGQCAICGKDLTGLDYTGISDTARANLAISHSDSTLTVSRSEAERLESESKSRLLGAKKLSLIVDLDQTIVHATVDPTVGEWMDDPTNPNHAALKGVGRFQLANPTPPGGVAPAAPEADACWYYLKQRPGLENFLKNTAELYEMHVYTMGTRAYAMAVCNLIDPTGELFGGRILSRDESGSLTQKSLDRLFPVDTSMVVIIDDRSDVWENSPNLVPVVPYNFFGIGDINGAYLPPRRDATLPTVPLVAPDTPDDAQDGSSEPSATTTALETVALSDGVTGTASSAGSPAVETTPSTDGSASVASSKASEDGLRAPASPATTAAAASVQTQVLTEQINTRPLKRRQEELEAHRKDRKSHKGGSAPSSVNGRSSRPATPSSRPSSRSVTPALGSSVPRSAPPSPSVTSSVTSDHPAFGLTPAQTQEITSANVLGLQTTGASPTFTMTVDEDTETEDEESDEDWTQEAVLVDRDVELTRLGSILSDIHTGFFMQDRPENSNTREVIAAMKEEVLTGVTVAFSSLWPMEGVPEQQIPWKQARALGAQCAGSVTSAVTHLIAAKYGTAKVNAAIKRGIHVVTPNWLVDASLLWHRPPEDRYLWRADQNQAPGPSSVPTSISGDEQDVGDMDLDWQKVNEEVMAGDDTDDDVSEVDAGDSNGVNAGKKRGRTSTASVDGDAEVTEPQGESPLSKRQRLARSRSSKLKISSANEEDVEGGDLGTATPLLDTASQASGDDDLDLDALASELWG